MNDDTYNEMRKWDRDELLTKIDSLETIISERDAYIDGLQDHVAALQNRIEKQNVNIEETPYEDMWNELYCFVYNMFEISENIEVLASLAKILSLMNNLEEEADDEERTED